MAEAVLYTDGSCMVPAVARERPPRTTHGRLPGLRPRVTGWGGWAAVVEHGHEGWVLRGSVPATTNVRMELYAQIMGLTSLPAGAAALVYTDCSTAIGVHQKWVRGEVPNARNTQRRGAKDYDLWLALAAQYTRLQVRYHFVQRRDRVTGHQRAHLFSQHMARQARLRQDVAALTEVPHKLPPDSSINLGWWLQRDPLAVADERYQRRLRAAQRRAWGVRARGSGG